MGPIKPDNPLSLGTRIMSFVAIENLLSNDNT